ncbi:shikimate 5-dehydrogenase [Lapidilactobacillus dextrinicus DSM 20335]|uniref:Shikimate dehydrogenase (NADP(+)) n=1 Tax=Lapidilactobacillus dextrinicus DSM 20335 TaxID=1423738 RepID=A0A0R2BUW1_9LACO|nr:shikimate dehydrogenase [Lapidilactobacillus dextrinicus]KRM79299.1 shikimate 5-dehydrogenase [Lapidilactobacillus dextrinicus DSM 20335]QFG46864.1 shikimate dehydrogenase [Lapidilactobacillus dextrinicus]
MLNKTANQAQYALLAHPAKHSLSPQIHNYGFKVNRLNAVYFVIDTNASGQEVARAIRQQPLTGCNLSLPLKETILPELDTISTSAQLIGAVNTVYNDNGRLIGENTDGTGLVADIKAHGVDLTQANILLLGGGATARAILTAFALTPVASVTVLQRAHRLHYQQVEQLIKNLTPKTTTKLTCQPWQQVEQLNWPQFNLLINATSIGFGKLSDQASLTRQQLTHLQPTTKVWDVIYQPRQSQLLQQAAQLGLQTHNGLGMLVQQAAGAFNFWTGKNLPVNEIESFLK